MMAVPRAPVKVGKGMRKGRGYGGALGKVGKRTRKGDGGAPVKR
jgi:hypothetical protein